MSKVNIPLSIEGFLKVYDPNSKEVNLLTQRMALQRELQERARKLEIDLVDLRSSIMSHLKDVQHVAEQQLTSARLRSEVSALAQTKLAAKLNQRR